MNCGYANSEALQAPVFGSQCAPLERFFLGKGWVAECGQSAIFCGQTFDDAVGEFAVEYADQNSADYRAFVRAIREGTIQAMVEG